MPETYIRAEEKPPSRRIKRFWKIAVLANIKDDTQQGKQGGRCGAPIPRRPGPPTTPGYLTFCRARIRSMLSSRSWGLNGLVT